MSENIDVKAVLSAQDDASPVIKALIRQVQRLEKLTAKANDPAKTYAKLTGAAAIAGKTAQAQERQAAASKAGLAYDKARLALGADLRQRMGFESRMSRQRQGEERRSQREAAAALKAENAARLKLARVSIAEAARNERRRYAELRAKLNFQAAMGRQRAAEARAEERATARREAAHRRQLGMIERENRARGRAFASSGRTAAGAIRDASNGIAVAGITGAAAAGYAGRNIIDREADTDAAERNLQIWSGLSAGEARKLRDGWASDVGIELGRGQAEMLTSLNDAIKAGVPNADAPAYAALGAKIAGLWEVDSRLVDEVMAKQKALQTSGGGAYSQAAMEKWSNTLTQLSKMSVTPEELLRFNLQGAGGGKLLGMSPEATLAFGASSISLGNKAGESGSLLDYTAGRLISLRGMSKQQGLEGDKARRIVRGLGYGSVNAMDAKRHQDPDAFLPDFFERMNRVKNPKAREQIIRDFFGQEWLGEGSRLVSGGGTYREAIGLQREAARTDAIGEAMRLHSIKLQVVFRQMNAAFGLVLGEMGKTLGPLAGQVAGRLRDWMKGNSRQIGVAFWASMQGLVEGLLGREGSFRDLLDSVFGKGGIASNPAKFYQFAKGFAEGLKEVWSALRWIGAAAKSFMEAVGGSSPEDAGKMAARILGIGTAARLAAPWLEIAKDAFVAIGAGLLTLVGAARVAGLLGGAGAAAGGAAALGAAAVPVAIVAAGLTLAVAVANWDTLREIWTGLFGKPGWTERREENDARRARGDNPDPVDSFLERWFGGAFGRRTPTSGERTGSIGGTRFASLGGSMTDFAFSGGSGAARATGADLAPAGLGGKTMLDAIARAEGTAGRGDYETVLGYGKYGSPSKPLASMNLNEAFAFGRQIKAKHGSSSALGRYQIVGNTMMDAARSLGMDPATTRFDAKTQDAMATWIAKRQGLGAWEGFRRNPAELATARAGMSGSQTINVPALTGAAAAGQAGAVDIAGQFLGASERGPGRGQVNGFMKSAGFNIDALQTAWCAGFVGSALAKVGIKGTGSLTASSYLGWGQKIDPSAVAKGDVLVEGRGRRPGETGAHVGLATGETRQGRNGLEIEMLSGNSGRDGSVQKTWERANSLAVRRAAGQVPTPQGLAASVPAPSASPASLGGAGMGGNVTIHAPININGANQSPEAIASAVERRMTERARFVTGDVEYDV